jgi:hypothetical protein
MSSLESFIKKYEIEITGTAKTKKKDIIKQLTQNEKYFVLYDSVVRSDPKYALIVLEKNPQMFEIIGEELKTNKFFLLRAVERNVRVYHFLSKEFKEDEFVELVLSKGFDLNNIPLNWKNTRIEILQAIHEGNFKLKNANEEVRNDLEICLKALNMRPYEYQYVSDELKKNHEICMVAISLPMENRPFFPKELFDNEVMMLEAFRQNTLIYAHMSLRLQLDKKFIKEIIQIHPFVFENLNPVILENKKFILELISEKGTLLEFLPVSSPFYTLETCMLAVKNDGTSIRFVEPNLLTKEIIHEALWDRNAFQFLPNSLKEDRLIILEMLRKNGKNFQHLPKKLKIIKEYAITALKSDHESFNLIPTLLQKDMEIRWLGFGYCEMISDIKTKDIKFYF